ncbi:MAG: hypothetical protein ACRDC4_00345 [Plesiomonas sp.]
MSDNQFNPIEWCQRMMDNAQDGDEAYTYYQLLEMWKQRLDK